MKKEVVKLRQRKQPSGNISLYLDIYVNGRRRYEYLHLYLVPGTAKEVRAKNKETLRLAEAVQAKRVVEVQNGIFGFEDTSSQIGILEYTQALIDKKYNGDNITSKTWRATYLHLKNYCKTDIPLANIDHRWVNGFIRHLVRYCVVFQLYLKPRNTSSSGFPRSPMYRTACELRSMYSCPPVFCCRNTILVCPFSSLTSPQVIFSMSLLRNPVRHENKDRKSVV